MWQLKTDGQLKEAGRFLYVPGRDDCKFTLKNFREIYADHPDLIRDTYDFSRDVCSKMLDNPDDAMKRDKKLMEKVRDDIHDDYSGSDADDMDDLFASMINS